MASQTQQDLTDAIVAMEQAAQELASASQRFDAAASVARRAAYATGDRRLDEVSTGLSTLSSDLAAHLAGLGLAPLVADASIARRAASQPDRTNQFVARWRARIAQLVP